MRWNGIQVQEINWFGSVFSFSFKSEINCPNKIYLNESDSPITLISLLCGLFCDLFHSNPTTRVLASCPSCRAFMFMCRTCVMFSNEERNRMILPRDSILMICVLKYIK